MSDENFVHVEIPVPNEPQRSMMDTVVEGVMTAPEADPNRADCELCGKNYSRKHLYNHRRSVHGIAGGKSGRIRTKPYAPRKKKTMEIAPAPKSNGHKGQPLPPLTAEQITRAAAEALFPDNVPHDMLPALLRWNIQTHYFLSEIGASNPT